MNKVLLHVGFPKAGSTFLGEWFHRHPEITFRDFAIGGFKDTDELIGFTASKRIKDKRVFVLRDMRFTAPEDSDHQQLDNIEDFQKRIADTLHSLFPNAKVLIITRGFESALKANYSQYLKQGGRLKFSGFTDKGRNSRWLPFNYSFILKLYTDLFGHDNVLILPFELLKTDADRFLYRIEQFLELAPFEYHARTKNRSLSPQQMALFRKMNKFMYIALFILGPLQITLFKLYLKWLDHNKTNSRDSTLFKLLSSRISPMEFGITESELTEKFKKHAEALKYHDVYQNYKTEYFID
jgi:hypothetical protein